MEEFKNKRYVTLASYAKLCDLRPPAISQRLKLSYEGHFSESDPRYLETCEHPDVEGVFVDTSIYKPKKFNKRQR